MGVILLVPRDHPLAGRDRVYLRELAGERFINLPANHPFQRFTDKLFRDAGLTYRRVMETEYRTHSHLIEDGIGVVLTTDNNFIPQSDGLAAIPLADRFEPRTIALYWNPRRHLSQAARDFRTFLCTYIKQP